MPSPPDRRSGERCAPQRGSGQPQPPKRFPLFSALRTASPDTIMMLIVDHKKVLIPFNLESIVVHLVMVHYVF